MIPPPPPSYSSATTTETGNESSNSNSNSTPPPTTPRNAVAVARIRERQLRTQILLYFPFFLLAHTTYCLFGQFLVHRGYQHHHQAETRSAALINLGTIFVTALMAVISTTLGLYGTVLESVPLLTVFWVVSAITSLWHVVLVFQFGFAYIAGTIFLLFGIYLARGYRVLLAERLYRQFQAQNRPAEEPAFTVVSVVSEKA